MQCKERLAGYRIVMLSPAKPNGIYLRQGPLSIRARWDIALNQVPTRVLARTETHHGYDGMQSKERPVMQWPVHIMRCAA